MSLAGVGCASDSSGQANAPDATSLAEATAAVSVATADPADDQARDARTLSVGTHCGVEVLGRLVDGYVWRTTEADGLDWIPREWYSGPVPPDPIVISVSLSDDGTMLTASLNGRDVLYVRDGQAFTEKNSCA